MKTDGFCAFETSCKKTVWTSTIVLLLGTFVLSAAIPNDLVKQIEKGLSGVQRRIVTQPSSAEKELIAARQLLTQLKVASPSHAKLSQLEKKSADLGKKLEKRLGRPIGGSAAPEKTKPKPAKPKAESSKLPSSVTTRLKRINSALDAVVTALGNNQISTAKRKLGEAKKLMDQIQNRYSAKIPAGNEQMKAATARLAELSAKFAKAEATAGAAAAAEAKAKAQRQAQSREWVAKLSPFFDMKSDLYLRIGAVFHRASDAEKEKCKQAFVKANKLMATYRKTEFPHGKTPALLSYESRLTGNLLIHNEGETRARQEKACRPWVDKLRVFVDVGAGSRKYLVDGVTLDEREINQRAALLEEARTIWSSYEKEEFPHGKTSQLQDLEERMQQRFKTMPESLRQSRALMSGDIEKEFDRILKYLNRDTGWRNDSTKMPTIAMARDIEALEKGLKRYAGTVSSGDAKLTALQKKLTQIKKQDQDNRVVRADRTYMLPDRYTGSDADTLRQKARDIVGKKLPKARVLRVTLPAERWDQESVIEWTDTSRTTLRHRTTRFMTSQVAAKGSDGKVFLHGVNLANNLQGNGHWAPLHGHVMWSDWMAEKNVNKEAPKP